MINPNLPLPSKEQRARLGFPYPSTKFPVSLKDIVTVKIPVRTTWIPPTLEAWAMSCWTDEFTDPTEGPQK